MPVKKKAVKKTAKRKTKKAPAKKTYVCVPCGAEVVVTKQGLGMNRLVCCGEVMQPKKK
jgi:transcription elongation factor Elf1